MKFEILMLATVHRPLRRSFSACPRPHLPSSRPRWRSPPPTTFPGYVGHDIEPRAGRRPRQQQRDADDQDRSSIPRYLRRQGIVPAPPPPPPAAAPSPAQTHVPRYRSKHFDAAQKQERDPEMRRLEPHVLSTRMKKLCDAGKVDDAVAMLKNAPLDAQNTPVWNTLMWECMKKARYQLAYQIFTDMKRRGFSPTTRTFQTMFGGLSRIEVWSTHPKQLENARSLYDAYQRHMDSVRRHDPASSELSIVPITSYIRILGAAGKLQDVIDVYENMDAEGPLSADHFVFTAIFQALAAEPSNSPNAVKSAADARFLWSDLLKASKKRGFPVDSHAAAAAVAALTRGGAADHALAFHIVQEYFGLHAEQLLPTPPGHLPLQAQSLQAALHLCIEAGRPDLSLAFFAQVKKQGHADILDRAHLDQVLRAQLALADKNKASIARMALTTLEWMLRQEITSRNGSAVRPAHSTYALALRACWVGADWGAAVRVFELMTGFRSHDFCDGAVAEEPRRRAGRCLEPSYEVVSLLVRAAQASGDQAAMRQCLRMVDYLWELQLVVGEQVEAQRASRRVAKDREFYGKKLAEALVEMVEYVLKRGEGRGDPAARRWRALAVRMTEELNG